MNIRHLFARKRNFTGNRFAPSLFAEGGDNTGGSSNTPNLDDPAVKAAIQAAVEAATAPLKSKADELLNEKKVLQEKVSGLDDETLKRFHDFQKRMETDEETRLIAEGKIDDVISKRTERMRQALTTRIEGESKKAQEWEKKYSKAESNLHVTLIDNSVRNAALEAGVAPTALDDVLHRAHNEFQYVDGRIVSKDQVTKEIKIGPDAKTPYSPKDFMQDLKSRAPHFWPSSASAGFTGGFGSSESAVSEAQTVLREGGMGSYLEFKRQMKEKSGK